MSDKKHRQCADAGQVKTEVNKNKLHKQNIGNGFVQGVGARPKSTKNDSR